MMVHGHEAGELPGCNVQQSVGLGTSGRQGTGTSDDTNPPGPL